MSSFTDPLNLEPWGHGWLTTRAFTFWIGELEAGVPVMVPAATFSDLGSVPRILWPLLPRDDARFAQAFVAHDYLCRQRGFPRRTAAAIMDEMLGVLAAKHRPAKWRVWALSTGVWAWALVFPYGRPAEYA